MNPSISLDENNYEAESFIIFSNHVSIFVPHTKQEMLTLHEP